MIKIIENKFNIKNDFLKRKGKFRIGRMFFRENPLIVKTVLEKVTVYYAQSEWDYDGIYYEAYSFLFDPVDKHTKAPYYEIEIKLDNNGYVEKVEFIKEGQNKKPELKRKVLTGFINEK